MSATAAALLLGATSLPAQEPIRRSWPAATSPISQPSQIKPRDAGIALVASALLPGAGQFYLKEERWVPFAAIEAWAWISYANQKSRGRSLEQRYRNLAWDVARRVCGCVRRDTAFAYYEAMKDFNESGRFDIDEGIDGIQPDTNQTAYNGSQWQRAKELYMGGQELPPGTAQHDSAIAYYRRNAVPTNYRWTWLDSPLEQDAFGRLIEQSDDALRVSTRALGLILANHVVSAIDALVAARLQAVRGSSREFRIGSELEPIGDVFRWKTTVRIPLGNE